MSGIGSVFGCRTGPTGASSAEDPIKPTGGSIAPLGGVLDARKPGR